MPEYSPACVPAAVYHREVRHVASVPDSQLAIGERRPDTLTRQRAFTLITLRRGSLAHCDFSWIAAYTPG